MHIHQEVSAIPVPNEISVIGFEGSAIFIPAPVIRNAILASNTRDPFELILLMKTTATAFNAVHENNGNMISTAITHSDNLNAWFCGVKQGLINKTRYSVIPDDKEVNNFFTIRHLQF
jgi:hypothetical protein